MGIYSITRWFSLSGSKDQRSKRLPWKHQTRSTLIALLYFMFVLNSSHHLNFFPSTCAPSPHLRWLLIFFIFLVRSNKTIYLDFWSLHLLVSPWHANASCSFRRALSGQLIVHTTQSGRQVDILMFPKCLHFKILISVQELKFMVHLSSQKVAPFTWRQHTGQPFPSLPSFQ